MNIFIYAFWFVIGAASAIPVSDNTNYGYKNCPSGEDGKLNVHLLCHTHNDVGWLKTVDQYYYGANQSIQNAGVQYILDSVIENLKRDPSKKFIYVETAFFSRWWNEQHDSVRHTVKKLVCNGQLEFVSGGWSMNDEAAAHYNSIIDQMTLGLRVLNDTFGKCGVPKVAWQIDPFGHSREQASLFAQMFFDGLFIGRLDYQDKEVREKTKTMEHIWKGSVNLGTKAQLFTGALPNGYAPPRGFCFDILCDDPPIMDDPDLKDYNLDERVSQFIEVVQNQSNHYATNHIVMTMGEDFFYQNAAMWFKNLDKLIKYVNDKQTNGSRVNVFYSTPSCYLQALNKANFSWSVKTDDFMPYASDPHAYWTGYFTSRPSLKKFERVGNNKLQICKQLSAIADVEEITLDFLRKAMGIMQHHDAITGTAKQHVTNDYYETLAAAIESCHDIIDEAYEKLITKNISEPVPKQYFCNYLNISDCPITVDNGQVAITIYNPLAWNISTYVRIPVKNNAYKLLDFNGKEVKAQVVPVASSVYKKAGINTSANFELVFKANLPPLGFATYLVKNTSSKAIRMKQYSNVQVKADGDWVLKNKFLSVYVDGKTGLLKQLEYKQDDKFMLPKAALSFEFESPMAYVDPLHFNMCHLYVQLVKDSLNEYAYAAELAGLAYVLGNTKVGIFLMLKGYNDKQHVLLKKIMERLTTFKVDKKRFDIEKEELRRCLSNFRAEQPHRHAIYFTSMLLAERIWTNDELLSCIDEISAESLQQMIPLLLSRIHIEALMYGNISKKVALDLMSIVEESFKKNTTSTFLMPSQLIREREVQLSDGCHYVYEITNDVHPSSAVEVYYQCGVQETRTNMLLELLAEIISEPCFTYLRTQEQLGYIVCSSTRRSASSQGLRIVVQSDKPPTFIDSRIEAFLQYFDKYIQDLTEEEFRNHVESLALLRSEIPKKMVILIAKYWLEISSRHYSFDRDTIEIACLRSITKDELYSFFKDLVAYDAPKRKKLCVQVLSANCKIPNEASETSFPYVVQEEVVNDGLIPPPPAFRPPVKIENVTIFKNSLPLYPVAPSWIHIPSPFFDFPAKAKL